MKNAIQWVLYWIPVFLLAQFCRLTAPIVCLFIKRTMESDVVKRYNKQIVELPRDNLIDLFSGWNTHDNNTDEWWYGMYNTDYLIKSVQTWTQEDYDSSKFKRYFCRVMWLMRNSAYNFNYRWFSKEKSPLVYQYVKGEEDKGFWVDLRVYEKSFHLEAQIPLLFGYINSVNIGWKAHKTKEKLLYAGRIIGIRNEK